MDNDNKEVFCGDCKYYLQDDRGGDHCKHKSNIYEGFDYLGKHKFERLQPIFLNLHSDCKNYKRVWYKFWVK